MKIGVYQGSTLSLYLFSLVMVTKNVQDETPWHMIFRNDVILIDKDKNVLKGKLNVGKKYRRKIS